MHGEESYVGRGLFLPRVRNQVQVEAVWQDQGAAMTECGLVLAGASLADGREFTAGGGGGARPLAWSPTSTGLPSKTGLLLQLASLCGGLQP